MPEYTHEHLAPWKSCWVHFQNPADMAAFSSLVGQPLTEQTRFIHFPPAERLKTAHLRYTSSTPENPVYPVYVISKGRAKTRLTSKALDALGVPYKIVVEPQEYDAYHAEIAAEKILVLPSGNLGQGSIPARNWVWEHAKATGAKRHWILDDNIRSFFRYNRNGKVRVGDGTIFRAAERFVDRYQNIGLAGFNYLMFIPRKIGHYPAFRANTRIYSTILIRNDLPFRWRGRYNEDTDLSLRVLKAGLCTVQFNAFLAEKMATMTMKGGNTDELYEGEGRLLMAQSLREQHPDVTKISRKWGRWQHHVDYRPFAKNALKLRRGVRVAKGSDDRGMVITEAVRPSPLSQPPGVSGLINRM